MFRFYAVVKITILTSHRDLIAVFKVDGYLEILCNLFKRKGETKVLKSLTHSVNGCDTFCFDGC